jgi:outer membrane protein assembly factor BamB
MNSRLLPALTLFAAFLGVAVVAACPRPRYVTYCASPIVLTAAEVKAAAKAAPAEASGDWPMYGGTSSRNMVNTVAKGIPTEWGSKDGGKNVKWVAEVGSLGGRYVPPAVAGGQVYVATNNSKPRDPKVTGNKAVLMCFREKDGQFLWQIAHDLPDTLQAAGGKDEGLLSTPAVDGDRLYYVTPGAELVCADTKGNVVWTLDMRKALKVSLNAAAFCSPLVAGDLVFAVTGNGKTFNELDKPVPEPKAPSFVAVDKKGGKVVWSDDSPGENIMDGTWASPAYADVKGKGQVIFPGGDGWLYAFEAGNKKKLLWKFDCNPKGSEFRTDSRGTRNYLMAPAVLGDRLYTAVGQQPDWGAGLSHVWCVDITKSGDVSEELEKGKANPNSGVVWHYGGPAPKGAERDWLFGRTICTCAVHDGLVYAAELDGFLHCLDAKTGNQLWEEDVKANVWASPLWVDGKVYLPDTSGTVHIFAHGKEKKEVAKVEMTGEMKAAPVVANGVLYLLTDKRLFAIAGK